MSTKPEEKPAWADLPNAAHIDRILAHMKKNPERWATARGAAWATARVAARGVARGAARGAAWATARVAAWEATREAAWDAAWDAARHATREAAWDAAWDAARHATREATREAAWDAARDAARVAARDALYALVAWDSAGALLDNALQDPDGVEAMRALAETGSHAAALLIPAVIAMKE